jgi:hypothetical protein
LAFAGYKHCWGVGRHYDGSNVFDYWHDPFGNKTERYTDGDVVNSEYPVTNSRFDPRRSGQAAGDVGPAVVRRLPGLRASPQYGERWRAQPRQRCPRIPD